MRRKESFANPFQVGAAAAPFKLDFAKFRTVQSLRRYGKQSRTAIADLITYSPSKMTSVVNDLIDEGILEEVGDSASTGGRKARDIDFNPRFGYFAAANIEPNRLDFALVDFRANIRLRLIVPMAAYGSPQQVLEMLCGLVLERLEKLNIPLEKLLGFGLTTPVAVDTATGTLVDSPLLPGWGGYQIDSHLREVFPYAVTVLERDVSALAHAELWRSGYALKTFLVIKGVVPIGVGIVIDGQVYRGASGRAGEIVATQPADLEAISRELASLIRFLDPEAVILAGDGNETETLLSTTIDRQLLNMSSPAQGVRRVERSVLGLEATMTGLIVRVAEEIFTLEVK